MKLKPSSVLLVISSIFSQLSCFSYSLPHSLLYPHPFSTKLSGFSSSSNKNNLNFNIMNSIQIMYDNLNSIKIDDISQIVTQPFESSEIFACMNAMNSVTLSDLGLTSFNLKGLKKSICLNIASTVNFHIAVFILPSGSKLPLHDHPNMTVLSKVISGQLNLKAFSLSGEGEGGGVSNRTGLKIPRRIPAHLTTTKIRKADDGAWLLTPTENNIHEFEACDESSCVILDVLLPPYDEENDRPCNFYEATPSSIPSNQIWILTTTEEPELPISYRYDGYKPTH